MEVNEVEEGRANLTMTGAGRTRLADREEVRRETEGIVNE